MLGFFFFLERQYLTLEVSEIIAECGMLKGSPRAQEYSGEFKRKVASETGMDESKVFYPAGPAPSK